MLQRVVGAFANLIEIVFIIYLMKCIWNKKLIFKDIIVCISMYVPCLILDCFDNWKMYVVKNLYLLFVFSLYLTRHKLAVKLYMPLVCILLSAYEILKILTSVVSILIVSFVFRESFWVRITSTLLTFVFIGIIVWSLGKTIRNKVRDVEKLISKKYNSYFIYILIVGIKIPFLYTDIAENKTMKAMAIVAICCTVIFFIISRIEKHNAEKERAIIEENNKILSTKLHKSQEILPAMVQVFSHVVEKGGTEMEGQEARKLLEEVSDLYGQQLKENCKEDLQLKNFCSTGLKLLDEQLKVYQMEARDRNVNLDIFVQTPIHDIIKRNAINQLKLQRAVGDMVRNSFRALERVEDKCEANSHILLIIGCKHEDVLEVAVVDNGENFPLHVIEAFGRRGVTTGGTGNGLADLVEFADETGASICVEEFAWETSSFTKKVAIIFDNRKWNCFKSVRKMYVKNVFWN